MSASSPAALDETTPPEAGPSSHRSPLAPTVTHDASIANAVESSLSRRRKNSLFGHLRSRKTPNKARHSLQRDENVDSDGDHENEQSIDRTATLEGERLREAFKPTIGILEGKSEVKLDDDWFNAPLGYPNTKPGYVWDVLFENQRGIHLLGKAYFSSRTLLPADPSPYTLPSRSIPSASSFTVARPSPQSSDPLQTHTHTTSSKVEGKRAIITAYTLETYQTPSPAWSWITPWLVNMKNGTDESGWRYNVWFRKLGWRSHAGPMGANGYVRRREWVRLRCMQLEPLAVVQEVIPTTPVDERDMIEDLQEAWTQGSDLALVGRILSSVPLDRVKLEELDRWFGSIEEDNSDESPHGLEILRQKLTDGAELHHLVKSFTHPSAIPQLYSMLERHGLQLPETLRASSPGNDHPSASRPDVSSSPDSSPSQESTPQTPTFMSPSPPPLALTPARPEKPAAFATPDIDD